MALSGAIQNSKRLFSEPPLKQKSGSSGPFSFFIILLIHNDTESPYTIFWEGQISEKVAQNNPDDT